MEAVLTFSCIKDSLITASKTCCRGSVTNQVWPSPPRQQLNICGLSPLRRWMPSQSCENWFSTNDYSRTLLIQSNNCIWKWAAANTWGDDTSIHFKLAKLISFAHRTNFYGLSNASEQKGSWTSRALLGFLFLLTGNTHISWTHFRRTKASFDGFWVVWIRRM